MASSSSAAAAAIAGVSASAGPAPIELVARHKTGTELLSHAPEFAADARLSTSANSSVLFSRDGSLLVIAGPDSVVVRNSSTMAEVARVNVAKTIEMDMSPNGSYLVLWSRPTGDEAKNLIVWDIKSNTQVAAFRQMNITRDNWPAFQWSDDEIIACRLATDSIHVLDGRNIGKGPVSKIELPNVSKFVLAPGNPPYKIATFSPAKGNSPASARIYQFPSLERPTCSRSFMRADKADIEWNKNATAILVSTSTDSDKTGKSYYGETFLYYLQADGQLEYNVTLDKEGPIADVKWSPLGNQFVAIYGFTPAKQTLFDAKSGNPVFQFGTSPRNTISWSPHGRFLCIAGFGNLAGDMDFWDRNKLKKMGSTKAECAVSYQWSPDSRLFIAATLHPRLRVDNKIQIFSYAGELLQTRPYDELYQVVFRPALSGVYPDRPQSPRLLEKEKAAAANSSSSSSSAAASAPAAAPAAAPEKKVGAYVPPHLRNASGGSSAGSAASKDIFKRADETEGKKVYVPPASRGGDSSSRPAIPGATGVVPGASARPAIPGMSIEQGKNYERNQKKKEKEQEKKRSEEERKKAISALSGTNASAEAGAPAADAKKDKAKDNSGAKPAEAEQDVGKRIRMINKTLQRIDDIKEKQNSGDEITDDERAKLGEEAALQAELARLESQWK